MSIAEPIAPPKKLYIKTHGCQMNEYDSRKMLDVLHESHKMTQTENVAEADMIIINTCSVREKAQEKLFSELGRWHKLKKKNSRLIIAVGGCVASQEGKSIKRRAPYVDIVFGPQTLHRLPGMLNTVLDNKIAPIDISFPEIEKFDRLPKPKAEGPKAYVSIMEGCSKYCSFCVVPYTRGEEISRPFDDVLAEIIQLTEQGVREIHLLGQNVNDYRGEMENGEIADLALLIHYISALDHVLRVRFTTSHPMAFNQHLIDVFATEKKLVNHLHLPVQSGSDRILTAMKRNYTALEYKSKIRKLRQHRPDICVSSDFIVGFPGETDADHQSTMKLIRDVGFDQSYSFIYSKRPGTPAAELPDDVPMEVKKQRLTELKALIQKQADAISTAMLGSTQSILVDSISKKSPQMVSGRTENNRVVNFQGDSSLIGTVVPVTITEVLPNSLRGKLKTT
jgi:tRNA-2-methylthio-N6-dimethylallyladenosine synthase